MREYTPENISILKPNEVFVFGSNSEGKHGKGAALTAKRLFGAKQGQSEGLMGHSYAIITKKRYWEEKSSTLEEIEEGVLNFIYFAQKNQDLKFLVTKLGSAMAGYTVDEMKDIWISANKKSPVSDNVILPKEYDWRQ